MIEKIRTIAINLTNEDNELSFDFHYGRRDFNNLTDANDENDQTIYFFMDPVESDDTNPNEISHQGRFMLLKKSSVDEEYDAQSKVRSLDDGKWRKYIKPLRKIYQDTLKDAIECDGTLSIERSRVVDVINLFDTNYDGILVNFTINEYL